MVMFRRPARVSLAFRPARIGSASLAGFAVWMALAAPGASQTSAPRSLAPNADFSKICQPATKPHLTRDWSTWDRSQPVNNPDEMYEAAIAYAEGRSDISRSPLTARKLLEDLADRPWAGRGRAHFRLGKLFLDPAAGLVDAERAASHFKTASSMLNMDASVLLAQLHVQGRIAAANVRDAEQLLRASATAGNIDGMIELARLQRSGKIGSVPQGATDDLIKLALQTLYADLGKGKCGALFEIGTILSEDALVPGGLTEAVRWFEAAARQGDAKADLALAEIYLQGRVEAAPEQFLSHLTRAAEAGQPRAMTLLGERLLLGDRAPKDVPKAIAWLERAGSNADPEAYKLLARHYRGEFGAAADLPKAADVLVKASALPGHTNGILVSLARLYAAGTTGKPDVNAALSLYRQAAARGDVGSLTEMAKLLLAYPAMGRSEEALRHLKEAASLGDADAMGVLAELYACSTAVAPDPVQAEVWLTRAAEAGHVRSISAIANQAGDDPAVAQRNAKALLRAAERGDRESMILLSSAYRSGLGVTMDEAASARWREIALAPGEGRTRAMVLLARRMLDGKSGGRDEAGARTLLEAAAQESDPNAQLELGRLLVAQRGRSEDVMKGVQLLRESASAGNAAAMLALAELPNAQLQVTGKTGLEWRQAAAAAGNVRAAITLAASAKDEPEAARWLTRIASLPVCTTRDMVELAQAYHKVPGPDHKENARLWMKRALADTQGSGRDPSALFLIGRAMVEEVGGPASKNEAVRYIQISAEAGRVDAMRYLGRGYVSGEIGESNMQTAVQWLSRALQKGDAAVAADLSRVAAMPTEAAGRAVETLRASAESGFAPAIREYGRSLQLGFGVPADPRTGAAWLLKAAEAGDTIAMKELSRAFASGYGVELSASASTEWLQRAARAGDPEAMYGLSLAMTLGFGTDVNASAAQDWLKTAEGAARK
ncbi:sel1 repeat family protein [Microvirga sp. HBU67558]|uniref:tetratricopeptide repeat protein n=1 Tax=Microvirga TaxID=186650 RepID=UPI001B3833DA|nr:MULTISPECIES: SEL1-like repeat protein [unclassified Microvirga]MBQ0822438.1 sel1 repeat family protein [Microvirga sp. HBU67558]